MRYRRGKKTPKNTDMTPLGKLKKELRLMEMRAKYNNREGGKYGKIYAQTMVIEYKNAIQILEKAIQYDRE